MSYDVYFFKLNPGAKVEEINQFLKSAEYEKFLDREDESDQNETESGLLPLRFIDQTLSSDELNNLLGRAWLKAKIIVDDDESTALVREYLNGPGDNPPEEIAEELDDLLEYAPSGGMQPLMFGYGPNLVRDYSLVVEMIDILDPKNIVMFDPQKGLVIDASVLKMILSQAGLDGCDCNDDDQS